MNLSVILQTLQEEAVQYKARLDLLVGLGKVIMTITARPDQTTDEQATIEQDLASIRSRYDDVWKGLEARSVILETTILQMERYRRMVRSLVMFLERAVRKIKKQAPVAGNIDKIRSQISEHKVLLSFSTELFNLSNHFLLTVPI